MAATASFAHSSFVMGRMFCGFQANANEREGAANFAVRTQPNVRPPEWVL
jgi:hypothetical protein